MGLGGLSLHAIVKAKDGNAATCSSSHEPGLNKKHIGAWHLEISLCRKLENRERELNTGVSETGSAKTGSAIDVRIDDAGSILKFRIGFSP